MRFWDTSAVIPLLVDEEDSEQRKAQLSADPLIIVWYGTPVELESALSRRIREGSVDRNSAAQARDRWAELEESWVVVEPLQVVVDRARRLLRVHPMRAADAMQLAAALVACEERPHGFGFLTGDQRLREAAEAEGFAAG